MYDLQSKKSVNEPVKVDYLHEKNVRQVSFPQTPDNQNILIVQLHEHVDVVALF